MDRLRHNFHTTRSMILVLIFSFVISTPLQAYSNQTGFPRLGNYYLRAGTDITNDTIPLLARHDLLILPAEAQIQNQEAIKEIRRLNPNITILAYVPAVSYNLLWADSLHQKLKLQDDWWLKDSAGKRISIWPKTYALNPSSGWTQHLANFINDEIMASNLWDGVLIDEVDECITCKHPDVDINQDGKSDSPPTAESAWRAGHISLLKTTRQLIGNKALIIINGSSTIEYLPYINGRMFESFPTPWESDGTWKGVMNSYHHATGVVGVKPTLFYFSGDTNNTGQKNYQDMRFGLTSALLTEAYFGYDIGTQDHGQLWWFDEYDVFLGNPQTEAINTKNPHLESFESGVWRRDFEKGLVLVNSTDTAQTVSLDEDFEKIHGTQDQMTNDGSIVSRVRVPAADGLVLLRLSEDVFGVPFPNGAYARIFQQDGAVIRTGFFLYDTRFLGNEEITMIDIDDDGTTEVIHAHDGLIDILNEDGTIRNSFAPYGEQYEGDVNVTLGDIDGNGLLEIITAPKSGGGPHIRIFSHNGRLLSPGFFAFETNFRGGVGIATGDIDGNGIDEIVATRASRGTPEVKIFRGNGAVINSGFMAYHPTFRGGVNVASGDVNGDGTDEIITGAGQGGGPHIRIFNKDGVSQGKGFFPYNQNRRDGVRVGVYDLDGDGREEILALTTDILP